MFRHPRREGYRQDAGNGAVSVAGGEKRKPLEKWAFRGVCPSSFLSLKFSAVDTWERHVETGKTREISFLVDYANLRYANPRKHHIVLM